MSPTGHRSKRILNKNCPYHEHVETFSGHEFLRWTLEYDFTQHIVLDSMSELGDREHQETGHDTVTSMLPRT